MHSICRCTTNTAWDGRKSTGLPTSFRDWWNCLHSRWFLMNVLHQGALLLNAGNKILYNFTSIACRIPDVPQHDRVSRNFHSALCLAQLSSWVSRSSQPVCDPSQPPFFATSSLCLLQGTVWASSWGSSKATMKQRRKVSSREEAACTAWWPLMGQMLTASRRRAKPSWSQSGLQMGPW